MVVLLKLDAAERENLPMKIRAFKVLSGHTSAVQCISAGPADMVRFSWSKLEY